MSAHTPGPWKALKATFRRETTEWFVTDDEGVAVIASCVTDKTGEPSEANARLIAAAPELLDALTSASNYIDALGGVSNSYRGVIAKAKGGAA